VHHHHEIRAGELPTDADLVVLCDGVNSVHRTALADEFEPTLERGAAKYIWFGTTKHFGQFTFLFAETEWGVFQAHVYPFSATESTFIVETSRATWERAGLASVADAALVPGQSDQHAIEFCQALFADHLEGHELVGNNSKWLEFTIVKNRHWYSGRRVLLGDAAHTAHFSIGSGTKLAFEDAIALSAALHAADDVDVALTAYEADRRPKVESLQRAAVTSQTWFEHTDRYIDLPSEQFAFQLLTRSQRITYDNLFLRDPAFAAEILGWFHRSQPADLRPADPATPPMFYPLQLRDTVLPNRIVVSPMAQYCAVDGMPTDWHLVHLGSRAVGGAGLVMTEMTCVSAVGRITPGCPGLWTDEQAVAWERITAFVHHDTAAKIGLQLGHSGRKGSTKVGWEGMDVPLDSNNWQTLAPSALPYSPTNHMPREMTATDMHDVLSQFVHSTRLGARANFDLLELHLAHGYLLSSFLSPLTNRRTDAYGGSLANRMRFPLEVVAAVRHAWPQHLPLSVRISATDWMPEGFDADEAVVLAAALKAAGVDIIDVSTGQVHPDQQPEYGRLYQTPFADRIRHEVDVPTMTVGAVSSIDDVNTVLLAGRADLCMLARPHLIDPYWTLNAAIDQGYPEHPWPVQYLPGQGARRREQSAIRAPR
jgi:anthraniloyl-CoA monooxygenase